MRDARLDAIAAALRRAGWGVHPPDQYIPDLDDEFLAVWSDVESRTMISVERAFAFASALRHVHRAGIDGDIAECGVWKGGACLLASRILHRESDTRRLIWLYDTFEGMPSPGDEDRIASSGLPVSERSPEGWWAAGIAEVRETLKHSPLPPERFRFVKGRVEDTLEREIPDRIAVLRLDTDWYESTRKELEVLYPRISPGGILIIDDYGHFTGARRAVDEYFARRGEHPLLHRSDYTGRVLVKD